MSDEPRGERVFSFPVSIKDPTAFLAELLLNVRASVDALAIITIEELAGGSAEKGIELAKHYEAKRESLILEYAFKLQDRPSGEAGKEQGE